MEVYIYFLCISAITILISSTMSNSPTIKRFSSKDIKTIFDGRAVKPGTQSKTSATNADRQTGDLMTEQTEMMAQSDKLG